MRRFAAIVGIFFGIIVSAGAQELTWRKDIEPIIKAMCSDCHGASHTSDVVKPTLRIRNWLHGWILIRCS